LHSVEQLAPDSQRLAKRVLSAAKNYATSDARIRVLVKTLADPNINVRSTAFRQIKQVGPQGYAAMLEVFGDKTLTDLWPGVRGAVRRLGDEATEILLAGATCGNPQIQVESYYGLVNLGTNEAIDLISFLYLSPNTPQNIKTFAEKRLREYFGGSIDRSALIANLSRKANQNLRGQRKNTSSNAQVSVWQYQPATNKFMSNRVSLVVASRIRAASMARLLVEIDPHNAQNRELFLLASIESAKKQAGPDAPIDAKAVLKTGESGSIGVEPVAEPVVEPRNHSCIDRNLRTVKRTKRFQRFVHRAGRQQSFGQMHIVGRAVFAVCCVGCHCGA